MSGSFGGIMKSIPIVGDIFSAGEEQDVQTSSTTSGVRLAKETDIEKRATGDIADQYDLLRRYLGQGPGIEAINASNTSQQGFIDVLKQIQASGGMPTDTDQARAQQFVDLQFRPQQEAMNQSFQMQNDQAAKLAAKLNRPINDPVIQAKLRQEQMRQQSMFDANRAAAIGTEARSMPFQRLDLQGQLADAQGALASQAMSNRLQLLNLGNALQSQERNWRLQTAQRYGDSEQRSGGGMLGGLGAVLGTAGTVSSIYSGFGGGAPSAGGAAGAKPGGGASPMSGKIGGQMSQDSSSYYQPSAMPMAAPMSPSATRQSRVSSAPYFISNSPAPAPNLPWGSNIWGGR
jgi:hypothetical protein